jgi:hypothetical protein
MYLCMYVYVHVEVTHTYMRICVCVYIYKHTYIHIHTHTYAYTYIYLRIRVLQEKESDEDDDGEEHGNEADPWICHREAIANWHKHEECAESDGDCELHRQEAVHFEDELLLHLLALLIAVIHWRLPPTFFCGFPVLKTQASRQSQRALWVRFCFFSPAAPHGVKSTVHAEPRERAGTRVVVEFVHGRDFPSVAAMYARFQQLLDKAEA